MDCKECGAILELQEELDVETCNNCWYSEGEEVQ